METWGSASTLGVERAPPRNLSSNRRERAACKSLRNVADTGEVNGGRCCQQNRPLELGQKGTGSPGTKVSNDLSAKKRTPRSLSVQWIGQDSVLAQPRIEFLEPESPHFIQTNEKSEGLHILELQPISIHPQERCHCCHRDAFVAVHKWMILGQAFPKRRGFLNEVL